MNSQKDFFQSEEIHPVKSSSAKSETGAEQFNGLKEKREERIALLNILEDIEESREKIEEEKNKTLAIIYNFTDGLFLFDKENNLFLINPQAEAFFNIKSKDVTNKTISNLSGFPTLKPLIHLLSSQQPNVKTIKKIFRKEMKLRKNLILEVSAIPIKKEEKNLGTLIILHNITREKKIERIKTEFVSLAAHQLRTPLSAIKWTLKMLLDEDLGKINEEQREFVEKTYESNERMISLINDLLDVTRIEEGGYLFKPILADIQNIIQLIINSYKEQIQERKIKFEFKKPKTKAPKVKVDVEKIKLVISNLLDNAISYTKPGGSVLVSLKYDKKKIEISIKDTGVGIIKDQQERVFSKFFRGANVIRMETDGSGLGLFITKNIIEAHGGKIWFESEENKGTTFCFTLPIKRNIIK